MDGKAGCTPEELEQVMEQYGTQVYRLAYARLRSVMDAEDVYQEVFLRYYRKRPFFETENHRKAWILKVAVNRAKSHGTSAWMRHMVPLEKDPGINEMPYSDLYDALGQMKPGDRTILHLFYYEELSVREIAELLSYRESNVRTKLTRARQRLAEIMKGETEDEVEI